MWVSLGVLLLVAVQIFLVSDCILAICDSDWVTVAFYSMFLNIHWSSVLTVLFGCYMAGAVWNCYCAGACSVYTTQPCTNLTAPCEVKFKRKHLKQSNKRLAHIIFVLVIFFFLLIHCLFPPILNHTMLKPVCQVLICNSVMQTFWVWLLGYSSEKNTLQTCKLVL